METYNRWPEKAEDGLARYQKMIRHICDEKILGSESVCYVLSCHVEQLSSLLEFYIENELFKD